VRLLWLELESNQPKVAYEATAQPMDHRALHPAPLSGSGEPAGVTPSSLGKQHDRDGRHSGQSRG
jgi:hypothetical protein